MIDLDLPWGGGDGILARMRDEADLPLIPVLILSARRDVDALGRLVRLVALPLSDYQSKPADPSSLAVRVRRLIGRAAHPLAAR